MTAHCDDVNAPPRSASAFITECNYRARHDIPKSGSRREAISVLTEALKDLQCFQTPRADKIQAALNYMIMHDGW